MSKIELRKLITEMWPFNSNKNVTEIDFPPGEEDLYDSPEQHMAVRSAIHNLSSLLEKVQNEASNLDMKKGIEPKDGMPYLILANALNDFLKGK
jgi:hypothetical protein